MNEISKQDLMRTLVEKRKSASAPRRCRNLDKVVDGAYECDHVSPITKSADNVNSPIFIMRRVWSWGTRPDMKTLNETVRELGYNPTLTTNIELIDRLDKYFHLRLSDVYVTNLFPFIPDKIDIANQSLLREAATKFGIPQIKIVRPKFVICLGKEVYNALNYSKPQKDDRERSLAEAIERPFDLFSSEVHCLAEPGDYEKLNRQESDVDREWRTLADRILSD